MSSKLIAIVGPSGTGKSTSIRTLDPKETFIINVARKELPFKGAEKLYNLESKELHGSRRHQPNYNFVATD